MVSTILLTVVAFVAFILYKTWDASQFWKKRSVKYKTRIPLLGDLWNLIFKKESFYESAISMYTQFPGERYTGVYQFSIPVLVIKDIDIIKQIGVKYFDSFMNHRMTSTSEMNELFSKNLIQLNGQEWREMRATLSPAFTSSKMKAMFNLICECADSLSKYYSEKKEGVIELEMKNLFTKYTNDVIATSAFGLQCDSVRDDKNEFYLMGKEVTDFTGWRGFKILMFSFLPKLFDFFRLEVFPKEITDFFLNTVKKTIAYRTEHSIVRPDMIHLLMEARKGKLKHEEDNEPADNSFAALEESEIGKAEVRTNKEITDVDIAAQAFIFFFAGFDTSSTVMSFMATELALNPDIQDKLFQEIKEVMENNAKPNYEAINSMKYLDMVVSESLRKWPAAPITDRRCNTEFTIKGVKPDEPSLTLHVGDMINIPILGLHRDAKYFPDPQKFDPERFSDERKHEIVPFSYLPFGIGPRSCIGSRFALLEIKILFTYLLSRMEFTVIKKTTVPIVLSKASLSPKPEGGFWVGLKLRE